MYGLENSDQTITLLEIIKIETSLDWKSEGLRASGWFMARPETVAIAKSRDVTSSFGRICKTNKCLTGDQWDQEASGLDTHETQHLIGSCLNLHSSGS